MGWIVLCFGAAAMGAGFGPGAWYASLNKPSFNPPNWIFGPVWTTLYLCMAIAAWRVSCRVPFPAAWRPLGLFLLQLALNAIWTPIFFGLHYLGWAFAEIVCLWGAILATILAFRKVDRVAMGLLVPYLAWVSFAAFLNFTLWRLNPQ